MLSETNRYAIIVAAGKGERMKSELPKQFMELNGRPVLMHTLEKFYHYDKAIKIVLVLNREEIERWNDLCNNYNFNVPFYIVEGGGTRFQSVKNGLEFIENEGLVAIHDGVRPLVSTTVIKNCYLKAFEDGNGVACMPLHESIRQIFPDNENKAVDRNNFRLMQTPQTFNIKDIKDSFYIDEKYTFTDEATVFEYAGGKINLVKGNYENIKITNPHDFIIAAAYLNNL